MIKLSRLQGEIINYRGPLHRIATGLVVQLIISRVSKILMSILSYLKQELSLALHSQSSTLHASASLKGLFAL